MLRSISSILENFERIGYEPDTPEWATLSRELQLALEFWAPVNAVSSRCYSPDDIERASRNMKRYLGIERLSHSDFFTIGAYFRSSAESAEKYDYHDEGVRLVTQFMQAEQLGFVARKINEPNHAVQISRVRARFPADESIDNEYEMYGGYEQIMADVAAGDIDLSATRRSIWLGDLLDGLKDREWSKRQFTRVSESSLENMKLCILQYTPFRYEVSYGLQFSVADFINFVNRRNVKKLSMEYPTLESTDMSKTS